MEDQFYLFDVCIVCALYEEAHAVMSEFSARCGVSFAHGWSRSDHYEYCSATIQNQRGESLAVAVVWLPRSGPIQTAMALKTLIFDFRPRFAAMTGICAGSQEHVQLGDLVVASTAYYYEEGKFIRGPNEHSMQQMEPTMTYPTDQVLQYVRGFTRWQEPVTEQKRRLLSDESPPELHIAAMASGMAVRADTPFSWLREKYHRNTVALDMEAASFYHTMRAFPTTYALVVKGVCDYANMDKNNDYHDYAARASAVYLLYFLQEYITQETMPRRDAPSYTGRTKPYGEMTLIRIQEIHSRTNDLSPTGEAKATINFDHGPQYPLTLRDPFTQEQEEHLEWYFEQHPRSPFMNTVKAQRIATSMTTYGHILFEQIFTDRKAYDLYNDCFQNRLDTLQIEIVGSPSFHRWHWEALKDPNKALPLSLYAPMVRRNAGSLVVEASPYFRSTINVLVVVARPFGREEIGYRTISRPLVDVLRQSKLPVEIEILRPSTYSSLSTHLRDITAQHGTGYYHIIHFDVHGALLSYSQFQQEQEGDQYLYKNSRCYGRVSIQPYDGHKAFLFFEDEENNQTNPVEVSELAQLLTNHRIPIAILNAYQLDKQMGANETSLGSRFMQAGVQLVLAMSYSVTMSAAELMMSTLYRQLFDQYDLSTAILHARQELYNRKERKAYFDQVISLEDWLLPVVYQNQPQRLELRPFTPQEATGFYRRLGTSYRPIQPSYGFVGRDLDILRIEKCLLIRRNIVLIQGMGGAGKTTLLQHLGAWWQTTHFVEHVFYFGYDERAWTHQQIITALAKQLYNEMDFVSAFQPLPPVAQQAMVCKDLRARRHVLILDNLESITGSHMAIQHTLSPEEQTALHRFLVDLAGGRTLVLLGSRGSESWLAKETFADNVYDLGGLDSEAASALTERLLERYNQTVYREDKNLSRLAKLLDGFPLALEVVLANLKHQTPGEILAALQAGYVTLNVGESEKRTENILRCIDYSHSNLSPEVQALLMCLAPFTSVLYLPLLNVYTASLKRQPALAGLSLERWQEVIEEAENWGLLGVDPAHSHYLRLQPILPYFLRIRLKTLELAEVQAAIETAFCELYHHIGARLFKLLQSKDPQERQEGQAQVSLEYENLREAVTLSLTAQGPVGNPYWTLSAYLDATREQSRGLELALTVLDRLEKYPLEKRIGDLYIEYISMIGNIASRQFLLKQYEAAEASYQKGLSIWLKSTGYDESEIRQRSGNIYHNLGIVAQEQRRWEKSEQYLQQALRIYIEFKYCDEQGRTYQQLGLVAQKRREWEEAEQYFKQALQIYIDLENRYEQAGTYHNLGIVAQGQRQWKEAEQYYQQALQMYVNSYDQARTYYQLGRVAQEQQQWEEAKRYFQQVLQMYIECHTRYEQAGTYHNLGIIAQEQGEWQQAKQYHQRALQIYIDFYDRSGERHSYHQLSRVAQGQSQQAEQYYQQAARIKMELSAIYTQTSTVHQLDMMEQEQWEETEQCYQPGTLNYCAVDLS